MLIEAGADPRATVKNTYGRTLEQQALGTKDTVVLRLLLESPKACGERTRQQVLAEWLRHAETSTTPEVISWLYEQGAEGNVRSSYK